MASYFKWYGDKVFKTVMVALSAGAVEGARSIEGSIKLMMGPPGPNEPEHRPGYPPHRQTGDYYESIKTSEAVRSETTVSAAVYSDIRRVIYFEKSKIPRTDRPTFKIALNSSSIKSTAFHKFAKKASQLI